MPDDADDTIDRWLDEVLAGQPPMTTPVVAASPPARTSVEVTLNRNAALELGISVGRRAPCVVKRLPIEVAREIVAAFTEALR